MGVSEQWATTVFATTFVLTRVLLFGALVSSSTTIVHYFTSVVLATISVILLTIHFRAMPADFDSSMPGFTSSVEPGRFVQSTGMAASGGFG